MPRDMLRVTVMLPRWTVRLALYPFGPEVCEVVTCASATDALAARQAMTVKAIEIRFIGALPPRHAIRGEEAMTDRD